MRQYQSDFPPPKPTALERWLTVANIEKYTVVSNEERLELLAKAANKFGPEWVKSDPVLAAQPMFDLFKKRGEEIAQRRVNAAMKAIEGG